MGNYMIEGMLNVLYKGLRRRQALLRQGFG